MGNSARTKRVLRRHMLGRWEKGLSQGEGPLSARESPLGRVLGLEATSLDQCPL